MAALVTGLAPLPVLFIVAYALALWINYPALGDQRRRLQAHAPNALAVGGLVFAAGVFTGILSGTGMVEAMSASILQVVPPSLGPYLASITAGLSIPATFLVSNDAFYFGMLPVIAQTAAGHGASVEAIARASLVGQQFHLLSPLVPSTYLLVGLARVEFGEHLRFTAPWALGACAVMLATLLAFGIVPLAH
jgi:citrate-Mg2+:H+ or citrate-Ca2+:H+ symporter, CitMHS family